MRSYLYVDEYGLVNTAYLVHATPFDPRPEKYVGPQQWHIVLLLDIGGESHTSMLTYPTRVLRDRAFETLCAVALVAAEDVGDDVPPAEPDHA